jgi:pimeloyl-ACP methyl ester carboxylesterase
MRFFAIGFFQTSAWCIASLLVAFGTMLVAVKFFLSAYFFWATIFLSFIIFFGFGFRKCFRKDSLYLWGGGLFFVISALVITSALLIFPWNGPITFPKSDDTLGLHFERMTLRDGNQLAYRLHTPLNQMPLTLPPIIILHGGPGVPPLKSAFDFYPRLTASGRKVYVYEQIGVGQSSKLRRVKDYTLQRNVEDLDEFRRRIGAQKVVLVGQSAGTIIAARYAVAHSEVVERLVLVSPALLLPSNISLSNFGLTARADNFAPNRGALRLLLAELMVKIDPRVALMLGSQEEMGRVYDRMWADPAFVDTLVCRGTRPGSATLDRANGANYFALMMTLQSMAQNKYSLKGATKLNIPVLMLRGECDFLPAAAMESVRDIFSNARTKIIKGAGHAVVEIQPMISENVILQFLAE